MALDALAVAPAAARVVQLSLQCLEHITAWDGLSAACHRPLLLSVLAALAAAVEEHTQPPPSVSPYSVQQVTCLWCLAGCACWHMLLQPKLEMAVLQVLDHLCRAFKVVEGLLSSSGDSDFDQELSVVHILYNLVSLGDKLSASAAEETLDLQGCLT